MMERFHTEVKITIVKARGTKMYEFAVMKFNKEPPKLPRPLGVLHGEEPTISECMAKISQWLMDGRLHGED